MPQEAKLSEDNTQVAGPAAASVEAIPRLWAALCVARERVRAVEKAAKNEFHRYQYASAEAIIAEASEAMDGTGLAVFLVGMDTTWEDAVKNSEGKVILRGKGIFTFRVAHAGGGYFDVVRHGTLIAEKGRPEDKAEYGAETESLAYFLRDLLLIPRVMPGQGDVAGRDDREREPGQRDPAVNALLQAQLAPQENDPEPERNEKQTRVMTPQEIAGGQERVREFGRNFKLDDATIQACIDSNFQHYPSAIGKGSATQLGELRLGDARHFWWRVRKTVRGLVPKE